MALPILDLELAGTADALAIAEMSRDLIETGLGWSWTPRRVSRAIDNPNSQVLVARTRGLVAGFGIMDYGDETAHLSLFAVRAGYQRRGLGRTMFDWLRASARIAGIAVIKLELRADNLVAREFYRTLGFVEAGWAVGYYQGRETALYMALKLRRQPEGSIDEAC
jgi:ribosomal-protein-alanine N-acetyltransferase